MRLRIRTTTNKQTTKRQSTASQSSLEHTHSVTLELDAGDRSGDEVRGIVHPLLLPSVDEEPELGAPVDPTTATTTTGRFDCAQVRQVCELAQKSVHAQAKRNGCAHDDGGGDDDERNGQPPDQKDIDSDSGHNH